MPAQTTNPAAPGSPRQQMPPPSVRPQVAQAILEQMRAQPRGLTLSGLDRIAREQGCSWEDLDYELTVLLQSGQCKRVYLLDDKDCSPVGEREAIAAAVSKDARQLALAVRIIVRWQAAAPELAQVYLCFGRALPVGSTKLDDAIPADRLGPNLPTFAALVVLLVANPSIERIEAHLAEKAGDCRFTAHFACLPEKIRDGSWTERIVALHGDHDASETERAQLAFASLASQITQLAAPAVEADLYGRFEITRQEAMLYHGVRARALNDLVQAVRLRVERGASVD